MVGKMVEMESTLPFRGTGVAAVGLTSRSSPWENLTLSLASMVWGLGVGEVEEEGWLFLVIIHRTWETMSQVMGRAGEQVRDIFSYGQKFGFDYSVQGCSPTPPHPKYEQYFNKGSLWTPKPVNFQKKFQREGVVRLSKVFVANFPPYKGEKIFTFQSSSKSWWNYSLLKWMCFRLRCWLGHTGGCFAWNHWLRSFFRANSSNSISTPCFRTLTWIKFPPLLSNLFFFLSGSWRGSQWWQEFNGIYGLSPLLGLDKDGIRCSLAPLHSVLMERTQNYDSKTHVKK